MALLTSLISAWELDEASGNAIDSHGSYDGTETSGTIAATTGPNANTGSRVFGGSTDSEGFVVTDNADLSFADEDFSFECWVYVSSTPTYQIIFAKGGSGNSREYTLFLDISSGNRFGWEVNDGASHNTIAYSMGFSTGAWYHIVCYHDSVNNVIGIVVNNGTPVTSAYSYGCWDGSADFEIGMCTPQSLYFDGRISLLRVWGKVLTSDERRQLYNYGYGLAYADFDVAPTQTVIDVDTGGTGDYSSLNAALSAEARNLLPTVGSNEIVIFDCRASGGAADTTGAGAGSWITAANPDISDLSNYPHIEIRSSGTNRHNGVWSSSLYRLSAFRAFEPGSSFYFVINGIQLESTGSSDFDGRGIRVLQNTATGFIIKNCILKTSVSGAGTGSSILYLVNSEPVYVYNNLLLDESTQNNTTAILVGAGGFIGDYWIENNTIIKTSAATGSGHVGINQSDFDITVVRNNLFYNFGDTNTYAGSYDTGTDYNTTDSTDSIGTSSNNTTSATFTFENAGSGDYRLSKLDLGARDKGSLISAVSGGYTTDMLGVTRDSVGRVDCGCFEDGLNELIFDVDPGGDGDFTTLNAAMSAVARDLTGTNKIYRFQCRSSDGSADSTNCTVSGWYTTDANNQWVIESVGADKHDGSYNTSLYRYSATLTINNESGNNTNQTFEIRNLQFLNGVIVGNFCRGGRIYNNIFKNSSTSYFITGMGSSVAAKIYNNLFLIGTNVRCISNNDIIYVENNTFICEFSPGASTEVIGIWAGGSTVARNNLVYGIPDDSGNFQYPYRGIFASGTDYNTTDSTGSIGTGSNNKTSQTFTFTDAGSGDYSLASGDTGARNSGTTLAGVSSGFTTDIIGTARDAIGAIDCGCFEYVAVISTSFIYFKRPTRVWNRRL